MLLVKCKLYIRDVRVIIDRKKVILFGYDIYYNGIFMVLKKYMYI